MSSTQEIDVENDRNNNEEEEDESDEPIMVGSMMVNVVGLRYYHGTVTSGEMVQLVREPSNPYDSNAIRVLNIRGEQVGHVEKEKAANLAPLVDGGLALLEGVVHANKGAWRLPCEVFIFSVPAMADAVLHHLELAGSRIASPHEPGSFVNEAGGGGKRGRGAESKRRMPQPASSASKKPSIDDIFESLAEGNKKRQMMDADESIIKSALMQHQKEALAWMVQRENSSEVPPFWEVQPSKGNKGTMYMNTLTNFTTDRRPEPLRGGILADDMGLGKTLTVLALVATNKPGAVLPTVIDIVDEPGDEPEKENKKRKSAKDKGQGSAKASSAAASAVIDNAPPCIPRADGPRGTLVVCPLSVMSNWVGQIEDHTYAGSFKVHAYHGPNRIKNAKALAGHDIVLTTYNMLTAEYGDKNSPLKRVHWLRLVLDEAHLVKNPNAQQTKCAVALNADRRWAVTGTPIQNNAKDLFSLMQFLHFEPLSERTFWNRTIQRPLTSGQPAGFSRLQGLMSSISLRRTKETKVNGQRLVELPPKIITVLPVELTSEDRSIYDKMEREGKEIIQRFLANGTVTKNYSVVLHIILRLRQICDHSSLCPSSMEILAALSSENEDKVASPELLQKMLEMLGDDFDCPICLSPPVTAIITRCAHVFCKRCIERTFERDKNQCPMCRRDLTSSNIFVSNVGEEEKEKPEEVAGVKMSAKISALLSILEKTRSKDPAIKSVVFSQFSSMLNLLERPLKEAGFKFVKLQGDMSAKKREEALQAFKSTDRNSPTVFLLSLKAAGVGLNLVSASNVIMMDPWWNPAVEEQAMDRVHRLGQTRDVHVFRLIVADSIEERLLKMQEKKRAYAQIAFGKKASEQRRQKCIEEVKLLMRC